MIKTVITAKEGKNYPQLKISNELDLVVYFTKPKTGIVIYCDNDLFPFGYKATTWVEEDFSFCHDEILFINK